MDFTVVSAEMSGEMETVFANIYNSANCLYPEDQRYPATGEIFRNQLKNDINYVCQKNGKGVAFFSYQEYPQYTELTSLYVVLDEQRQGIGQELLLFFEGKLPVGTLVIVKALKESPWAVSFYEKHGYVQADETLLQSLDCKEEVWETVLLKRTA